MFRSTKICILILLLSAGPVCAIENVLVQKDIVYKTVDGTDLHLSITRPENSMNEDLPLVVYMHGGSWYAGHYNQYLSNLKQFAETGDFVLASVQYRFSPKSGAASAETWPAQIEDCQDALNFLLSETVAEQYGIDTDHVGTWGYSAGGHLSNLLAVLNPDTVSCEVNYSGPTDFELFLESPNSNAAVKDSVEQLLGGSLSDPGIRDLAISASPITYLAPNSPPTLLVQTVGDTVVPYEQITTYHNAAQAMGADTTLWFGDGDNHGMDCFYPARLETLEYFYSHLTDGSPYQYKYETSFEASEGYTAGTALPGINLVGQDGWTQGAWGSGAVVAMKTTTTMDDTFQAIRLGTTDTTPTGSASAYQEFTSTPLTEGAVEVWIDLRSHGTQQGFFAIGDENMTFGEAGDGSLLTGGIAAMFGVMNDQAVLYDGDEIINPGVSVGNGVWNQFHAILYPETQKYALEVLAANGTIVVGFDDWVSTLHAGDVGTVDLFSFRDTNVTGIQNVGLAGTIHAYESPMYADNLSIYQAPGETAPVATQWKNKCQISFEASEGYTATAAVPGTDIIGQNGWTVGAWGTGTTATARDMSGTIGAPEGDVAMRIAGGANGSNNAAAYKEVIDAPITDSKIDVWVDMTSYGGYSYFTLGDNRMVFGDDGAGNALNDGIAAMFGMGNNNARVIDGDTVIDPGITLTSGEWYQFHATLYLDLDLYALEIFDSEGNLVVGVDDWVDASSTSDMGDYDLFSFRDTTVDGIQNVGVRSLTVAGQPLYLDNIRILVPESEEPIAGDANSDGRVDGSDVTILAGNWQKGVSDGLTASWGEGDFNGDGRVDGSDVTILAGNWQYGVTAAAASVPEPSAFVLLLMSMAFIGFFTRKWNC